MGGIGYQELLLLACLCTLPVGALGVVGIVLHRARRSTNKLAPCPLCRTAIDSASRVCANCKRDLPESWA